VSQGGSDAPTGRKIDASAWPMRRKLGFLVRRPKLLFAFMIVAVACRS
jgi:hypothetical protein